MYIIFKKSLVTTEFCQVWNLAGVGKTRTRDLHVLTTRPCLPNSCRSFRPHRLPNGKYVSKTVHCAQTQTTTVGEFHSSLGFLISRSINTYSAVLLSMIHASNDHPLQSKWHNLPFMKWFILMRTKTQFIEPFSCIIRLITDLTKISYRESYLLNSNWNGIRTRVINIVNSLLPTRSWLFISNVFNSKINLFMPFCTEYWMISIRYQLLSGSQKSAHWRPHWS